ncbi:MAG: preprotein translocase subunit YajC, partial [Pseudomonadota bacterium]
KAHQRMVDGLRRGDEVVTQGGLKGKVTKVKDGENEIEVELAKGMSVRVVQSTIADVINKTEPAK